MNTHALLIMIVQMVSTVLRNMKITTITITTNIIIMTSNIVNNQEAQLWD